MGSSRLFERVAVAQAAIVVGALLGGSCTRDQGKGGEGAPATAAPRPPPVGDPSAAAIPGTTIPDTTMRQLDALGYAARNPTDNPEDRGVTALAAPEVATGLNLYSLRREASAVLVDMHGSVVHRWESDTDGNDHEAFMHVEPLPNGELLAIVKDVAMTKLDWDSRPLWRTPIRAHHDFAGREDGRILVLTRDRTELEFRGKTLPILADGITILGPDGRRERTIPLLPLFRQEISNERLTRVADRMERDPLGQITRPGGTGDVLHANSIAILRRDIPGIAVRGSLLLSFRAISRIAIIDAEATRVLWIWGASELDGQHDATQLESGRILLFDNRLHGSRSRVLEVTPETGRVTWSYQSPDFFSRLRGGAQALANGNVLITESEKGHALEVNREGEIVWEYWQPSVTRGGATAVRSVIYRLNRYDRTMFGRHLEGSESSPEPQR